VRVINKTKTEKKKIIIVDDHPVVRQGLSELINREDDLCVCGEAEDTPSALRTIRQNQPDLAIVDLSLKDSDGLELIKDIKAQFPKIVVLVLSMHDEVLYSERALRAGARGYMTKHQATENVIGAVRKILTGGLYISDQMTSRMVHKMLGSKVQADELPTDRLSDRELQVFTLIGQGFGTREIADKLYLSIKTIETYRSHIKEKLNFDNSGALLRYAIQWAKSNQ